MLGEDSPILWFPRDLSLRRHSDLRSWEEPETNFFLQRADWERGLTLPHREIKSHTLAKIPSFLIVPWKYFVANGGVTWQAASPSPQMSREFTLTTEFWGKTESVPVQCKPHTLQRNCATNYDKPSDHTTIGWEVWTCMLHMSAEHTEWVSSESPTQMQRFKKLILQCIQHARQLLYSHSKISDRSCIHSLVQTVISVTKKEKPMQGFF